MRDGVDHAEGGQRPGEDAGQRHDQHDDGGQFGRFAQDGEEVAQLDGAVDEYADEQTVEHRDHGGFRGREPAHAHPAQDQDRRRQAPRGLTQAGPEGRARQVRFQRAHLVLAGQPYGRDDQRQAGQDAGHHAGGEQGGHRGPGHQHRVDDEGDRRRDQDVRGGAGCHDGGRERTGIAGARHRGDHHRAHGRRACRAGAGDPAQEHGDRDRHQRQHARTASDDGDREVHQPLGHAGAVEDRPHQHEHGDRQQRVLRQARVEILRHGQQAIPGRVQVGQHDGHGAAQAQRHADRHADQHQDDEDGEEDARDHGRSWEAVPAGRGARAMRRMMPMVRSEIDAAMTGSQIEYHQVGTPIAGEVSS
ncbi:hypothetical protein D9M68_524930 [compost metagenome]